MAKIFQKKDWFSFVEHQNHQKNYNFCKKKYFPYSSGHEECRFDNPANFFPKIQTNFCFKVQTCRFITFFFQRAMYFLRHEQYSFESSVESFTPSLRFFLFQIPKTTTFVTILKKSSTSDCSPGHVEYNFDNSTKAVESVIQSFFRSKSKLMNKKNVKGKKFFFLNLFFWTPSFCRISEPAQTIAIEKYNSFCQTPKTKYRNKVFSKKTDYIVPLNTWKSVLTTFSNFLGVSQ